MIPSTWTSSDTWNALQRAVSAVDPYAWVVDFKPIGLSVVYGSGGRTYEAPFDVADDGTVTLSAGVEVRSQTVYWPAESVAFASATDASGRVRYSGLIFRAGRFPERPIREITEADLDAMVASFPADGVPVCVDHNEASFLAPALERDGARLRRVWRQGDELHGEVEVPGWFAAAARDLWKGVSVGLDSTLRRLREISFVSRPRVADAAVFAGAPAFTLFAQAHPDLAATVRHPAAQAPAPQANPMPLNRSLADRIKAFFRSLPAEQREGATEADLDTAFSAVPPAAAPAPTVPPADSEVQRRLQELEAQFNQREAEERRQAAALAFYEEHLRAGRVTPAQREDVVREHLAAQFADEAQRFAADSPSSFVRALAERYARQAPAFRLGGQRISGAPDPALEAGKPLGVFSDADFANAFGTRQEAK